MRRKCLDNDEVVRVPLKCAPFSIRLHCCDCGLAHDVRILKHDGLPEDVIEMIFSRNRRATAQYRRTAQARVVT